MLRIVHTGCGAIEGIAAPEPEIPVAAPPVGDLRQRARPSRWQLGRARWRRTTSPPPVRSPHRETRTSSMTANGARIARCR